MSRKRSHRGLDYRRTKFHPGFGICKCTVCTKAYKDAEASGEPLPAHGSLVPGCQHINREKIFADAWERENNRPGINFEMGVLQDLMVRPEPQQPNDEGGISHQLKSRGVRFIITQRERTIVATVIQWFGSTCGMDFIKTTLGKCGFAVIEKKQLDELYKDRDKLVVLKQPV